MCIEVKVRGPRQAAYATFFFLEDLLAMVDQVSETWKFDGYIDINYRKVNCLQIIGCQLSAIIIQLDVGYLSK